MEPRAPSGRCTLVGAHLKSEDFDLLVMGAYDHPRWFELLFGGATQSIMLSSPIPIFLSN
jgi:nucleotide-binding universal stress UspA family protein